jgi:hypothetical protein
MDVLLSGEALTLGASRLDLSREERERCTSFRLR